MLTNGVKQTSKKHRTANNEQLEWMTVAHDRWKCLHVQPTQITAWQRNGTASWLHAPSQCPKCFGAVARRLLNCLQKYKKCTFARSSQNCSIYHKQHWLSKHSGNHSNSSSSSNTKWRGCYLLNYRCNGSERLLLSTFHVRADICDNSRFKETSSELMSTAASDHSSTLGHCILHMQLHLQTNRQFSVTGQFITPIKLSITPFLLPSFPSPYFHVLADLAEEQSEAPQQSLRCCHGSNWLWSILNTNLYIILNNNNNTIMIIWWHHQDTNTNNNNK